MKENTDLDDYIVRLISAGNALGKSIEEIEKDVTKHISLRELVPIEKREENYAIAKSMFDLPPEEAKSRLQELVQLADDMRVKQFQERLKVLNERNPDRSTDLDAQAFDDFMNGYRKKVMIEFDFPPHSLIAWDIITYEITKAFSENEIQEKLGAR